MKVLASLALAVISLSTVAAVNAAQLYPKMYDATYESTSAAGKSEMRLTSDGKGKLRSEIKVAGNKTVSISDYPGKMSYAIMDAQKMIMKTPLKTGYEGNMDPDAAKKKGAKDLGVKNINGHTCQGWSYTEGGAKMETWIDNAAQLMVKSTVTAAGTTSSTNLIKVSAAAPSADLFAIPTTGYKTMTSNY